MSPLRESYVLDTAPSVPEPPPLLRPYQEPL